MSCFHFFFLSAIEKSPRVSGTSFYAATAKYGYHDRC